MSWKFEKYYELRDSNDGRTCYEYPDGFTRKTIFAEAFRGAVEKQQMLDEKGTGIKLSLVRVEVKRREMEFWNADRKGE